MLKIDNDMAKQMQKLLDAKTDSQLEKLEDDGLAAEASRGSAAYRPCVENVFKAESEADEEIFKASTYWYTGLIAGTVVTPLYSEETGEYCYYTAAA